MEDLEPVLPESLRFRNKHLKNTGADDELLRAEALELGEVVFEDHITSSFDAVDNVVLAALKDFQNFS